MTWLGRRPFRLLPPVSAGVTLADVARITAPPNANEKPEEIPMRKLLLVIGILALAIGLLWIGQGTGVIKWPESSFMISQIQWAYYGAALAVVGLILIWRGKR
jgi:uncharacterized membrane protein